MENFNLGNELEKTDLQSQLLSIIDLDPLEREQERNRIAKEYGVRKSVIDQFIKGYERKRQELETSKIVSEVEPAEEPVDGAELMRSIKFVLEKHVILPAGVAVAIAAWVILTYCYDAFRILCLLGIISPVKRCGKTTLLEVLHGLCNKALTASNISPAAVFRTIEKYQPTLLVDEFDTFVKENEELRGVLNSGHTKAAAFVVRIEKIGDNHEPARFSTWGPKALAMIGTLPGTIQDRSVVVSLRRKTPGESVARINHDFETECLDIRRRCRRWADDNMDVLKGVRPDIPATDNDRVTDNWMPLIAIADVAGGDWPGLMRKSMLGMLDATDESMGPRLLRDIKNIFDSHLGERIFSEDLVDALNYKKESPWCDRSRGRGLTQNALARMLKPFNIKSKTMRIGEKQRKGYTLDDFQDAFQRYIPLTPPIPSVPTYQINNINNLDEKQSVPNIVDGTDDKRDNLLKLNDCYVGTDEKGGIERSIEKCFECPACDKVNGVCYASSYFDGKSAKGVRCHDAVEHCQR